MSALRPTFLRSAPRLASRPLSTLSIARPAPLPRLTAPTTGLRYLQTSQPALIGASKAVGDGGNEEAPHSGINVDKSIRMDTAPPPEPGADFNVCMIGAGNIMFGSDEGPWNHSFRLEHKLGTRLKVVALIDPSIARAERVLEGKRQSFVESAYRDTKVFKTIEDYHAFVKSSASPDPHAIVVGSPPAYRGGLTKGSDLEINLIHLFPKTAYFIEKPVGTGTVEAAKEVTQRLIQNGNIVSVGYMLRYLRCVQKMKQIIHENQLTIMATNARYSAAYEAIAKPAWWNKAIDMGPVIEQGTHFCDLSRYFGGDVDINSVVARSVEFYEEPGKLSKIPIDENKIPEELRIPRLTSAIWKYENGAVGSFTHAVALQGHAYACELELWADGYHMRLVDPYQAPTLYVRRPGDDHEERFIFNDDDPFFSEMSSFIDCIEGGPNPHILSSFEDATKTYELTWAIRLASEAARAPLPSRS
ncbi:putative oxidoreductase C terminal-domain-containing protein [Naematelia encephala]|uniref:Putative oxidoreductase C terminal-domain-containing protein n=1 Tax=Naematelia encephala TaxID=71784 RepID=A0A1Y2AXC2_9TREE|nr:putative oxidoreductase C terminal-domain-containing protein [Naematelia encephala]